MQLQDFFKSLSDDTRLACMLLIYQEQELCVCELVEALRESQPKISRHLAQLRTQGLVLDRKKGQWVFYSLNNNLPTWAINIIQQAAESKPTLLKSISKNLKAMKSRPARC